MPHQIVRSELIRLADSVLILRELQRRLRLRLQVCDLILVLVQQVLDSLLVNLDLDLVLLFKVLKLALFVSKLRLFILQILLLYDPEVIQFLSLPRFCFWSVPANQQRSRNAQRATG